jgi:hypothetical protein
MMPAAAPQQRLPLPIAPRGGAIGTVVTLGATGLPPEQELLIAFANLQGYQLLKRVTTDVDGAFATTLTVPPWAQRDGLHYVFASFSDEIPLALSSAFHVTAPDGIARIEGTIGSAAGGCVDLSDGFEGLYHLVGEVGDRKAGDKVAVAGTIEDAAACSGKGIVIRVTEVTAQPGL